MSNKRDDYYEDNDDEHAADRKREVYRRIIICIGGVCLLVHSCVLLIRFFNEPLITEVHYAGEATEFPDVTLCHTGPYSMSRSASQFYMVPISNTTIMPGKELVYSVKNFWKAAIPEYRHLALGHKYTRDDNPIARNSLFTWAITVPFMHYSHESILECTYKGKRCSFPNFSSVVTPPYLRCFTFSFHNEQQRISTSGGEEDGLSITILDADRRFILSELETLNFLRGMMISLHEKGTYPNLRKMVAAQIGFYTALSFTTFRKKLVNKKGSECNSTKELVPVMIRDINGKIVEEQRYQYSFGLCRQLRMQEEVMNKCKCVSEKLIQPPHSSSIQYCHKLPEKMITANYEKLNQSIKVNITGARKNEDFTIFNVDHSYVDNIFKPVLKFHYCSEQILKSFWGEANRACKMPCEDVTYSIVTAKHDWPTAAKYAITPITRHANELYNLSVQLGRDTAVVEKRILNNDRLNKDDLEYMKGKFLKVSIYPSDPMGTVSMELFAYPGSAFLSDFGGILGFWIGFSIVTIFELVEKAGRGIMHWCGRCSRRTPVTEFKVHSGSKL